MFRYLKTMGCCLILLAPLMASFSDTQAAPIIIDTFDEQQAPPGGTIPAASAIGGVRSLSGSDEVGWVVDDGAWISFNFNQPGGDVTALYDGGGSLDIDLTDAGTNDQFEFDISFREFTESAPLEKLFLTITDVSDVQSSFSVNWEDLPFSGTYAIPFSALTGGADLELVKSIQVMNDLPAFDESSTFIVISEIRAVPEPSTAALTALGLVGLAARRRRA